MLSTLLKIGKWRSQGMTEWDRFIDVPKVESENKKGVKIRNYVVGLVFDLDEGSVYLDRDSLKEYDEDLDAKKFMALKVQGGNNKAIYATTEPSKAIQIFKTFFGKIDEKDVSKGELIEAIEKGFPDFKNSRLYEIAESIFTLRDKFFEIVKPKESVEKLFDFKNIVEGLGLGANEQLVLVYACLKSDKYGCHTITPIARIEDYLDFLKKKFFARAEREDEQKKLCYASSEMKENVGVLKLTTRYSLNKMFVTETKNYATSFEDGSFFRNYQLNSENEAALDIASSFLLNNYKTKIAGHDHVIIPLFLESTKIDWQMVLDKLKTSADLLFSFKPLDELAKNIETEVQETYWLTFLAFESDGNFFKTTNVIKDVSKFHFQHVIQSFRDVDWEMREMKNVVDWDSAIMEYGKVGIFNLNAIYGLIPIRKEKEKRNQALLLFKSILENRKIETQQLFGYFTELILCHYYARQKSYTNIKDYGNEYFDFAIRDSVFKCLAFIQVLKKINLINMEDATQDSVKEYEKRITDFFVKMKLSSSQKAMFFLGRMLSSVVYLQEGKSKTVIDRVNFHGMNKDDIIRLRKDLFEKAKQYGKPEKVIFNDSQFGSLFDFNDWNMSPEEAVFFLLTGYSFGIIKKDSLNSKS